MITIAIFAVACSVIGLVALASIIFGIVQTRAADKTLSEYSARKSRGPIPMELVWVRPGSEPARRFLLWHAKAQAAPVLRAQTPAIELILQLLANVQFYVAHYANVIVASLAFLVLSLVLYYDRGTTVRADAITATYATWVVYTVVAFVTYAMALYGYGTRSGIAIAVIALVGAMTPAFIALGTITSALFNWCFFAFALAMHVLAGLLMLREFTVSRTTRQLSRGEYKRAISPYRSSEYRAWIEDPRTAAILVAVAAYVALTAAVVVVAFAPEFGNLITSVDNANLGQVIIALVYLLGTSIASYLMVKSYEALQINVATALYPAYAEQEGGAYLLDSGRDSKSSSSGKKARRDKSGKR